MKIISWKVTVNFFAMKTADKRDRAVFKNKAEAIFAQPDAVILAGGFEPFEIWNLLERQRGLDCSMIFRMRRNRDASVMTDKSESKDSRKAVFTRHGRDAGKFWRG
jgi:hypothetical protein